MAVCFVSSANNAAHLRIGGGGGPQWRFKGLIDEVRIYKALPSAEQIAILSCPDSLSRIAAIPPQMRSEGAAAEDPQCISRRSSIGHDRQQRVEDLARAATAEGRARSLDCDTDGDAGTAAAAAGIRAEARRL